MTARVVVAAPVVAALLAGCGLSLRSQDDFLLTRTGAGKTLTVVVNDGGTITCNGSKPRPLAGQLLLQARDLVTNLDADAKEEMNLASTPGSVYRFTMKFQDGTISFPDTAGGRHTELGAAEQFALEAAQGPCVDVVGP